MVVSVRGARLGAETGERDLREANVGVLLRLLGSARFAKMLCIQNRRREVQNQPVDVVSTVKSSPREVTRMIVAQVAKDAGMRSDNVASVCVEDEKQLLTESCIIACRTCCSQSCRLSRCERVVVPKNGKVHENECDGDRNKMKQRSR